MLSALHPPKDSANLIQALKDKSPQDIKILVHTSGPSHEPIHYTEVLLVAPDIRFKAAAKNKSESKSLATKEAVNYLEAVNLLKTPAAVKTQKSFKSTEAANRRKSTEAVESVLISQKTQQAVVDAVQKRWKEMSANLSADIAEYESMAAFVAVSSRDHSCTVLSIGTNGSWALAESTANTGKVVHDSHAVVVARRALLCLLYENLLKILENQNRDKPEFILQKSGKGYRLKTYLKLYLYCSVAPSGSATLVEKSPESDKLHTKYLANDAKFEVVSLDKAAIEGSGKAAVMSTSDKIALWNVVGLQGSLLSAFIEPLYIDGLILADESHSAEAVKRALFERVDEKLLEPKLASPAFHLNRHPVSLYKQPNPQEQLSGKLVSLFTLSFLFYRLSLQL